MSGRFRLLLLIAGLLLVLLLVDRIFVDGTPDPAARPTDVRTETGPEVPLSITLPEALARYPLFQPSRQAAVIDAAPALLPEIPQPALPQAVSEPAPGPDAQPLLLGVVTDPAPGGAFVGDTAGGPIVYLEPGEESRGLHLTSVASDRALFHGPDGEVTLLLPSAIELGKQ